MNSLPKKDIKKAFATLVFDELGSLRDAVQSHPDPLIASRDLDSLSTTLSRLEWHPEGKIDFEPQFCDPFPAAEFDDLFEREKVTAKYWYSHGWPSDADGWPSDEYGDPETRLKVGDDLETHLGLLMSVADYPDALARHGDWTHIGCWNTLYTILRAKTADEQWQMRDVHRALPWPQDPLPTDPKELRALEFVSKPDTQISLNESIRRPGKKPLIHVACTVINNGPPVEDTLLRSELLCAISIMRDQMRPRPCWEYGVFPTFIYSFSGLDVRMLQCHYDARHGTFHVRKTPYMHIGSNQETDKIKLILRWMMNKPKGDLKLEEYLAQVEEGFTFHAHFPEALSL